MLSRCRIAWTLGASLAIAVLANCHTTDGCDPGEECSCTNGVDCDLGCTGDGCAQECDHLGDTCGLVCNDGCVQTCSSMPTCTSSCGDDCNIECDSITKCSTICGARCTFDCHDATTCAVEAGPGSVIDCNTAASCQVDCTGDCQVSCTNTPDCEIRCADGRAAASCSNGTFACGPC